MVIIIINIYRTIDTNLPKIVVNFNSTYNSERFLPDQD